MPIRVLHIVNSLGQGSGVMSFIMNLYRNIDREKIQFDFIVGTSKEPNYEKEIRNLGGYIYNIPAPRSLNIKKYLNYKEEISSFFQKNEYNYEIIHSHVPIMNTFYFPIAKKNNIKHRIVHSHSTKSSSKKISRLRNSVLLLPVKRQSTIYFACSEEAGEFLFGRKKILAKKVYIINNAIDTKKFKYNPIIAETVKKELNIEEEFVIGHIGRFANEKNHLFLIDVFAEIVKIKSNSVLLLIGDGELVDVVKEKVQRLDLTNKVKFLGIKENINQLLQSMDVFILPSHFEGLGIVTIEAQSAGVPCFVSTNVPSNVDVTNIITHLSLKESPKIWAKEIIENNLNQPKYVDKSKYTEEIIKSNYDIERSAKWLTEFYENLN